jgi:hypothetical protein
MAMLDAFLDGVTATGLFGKRNWPGSPTELIDSRSPEEFDADAAAVSFYESLILTRSVAGTRQVAQSSPLSRHS